MHRLILPAAFMLLLNACSTYQYMTVDSTQLKKNDHSQLTFENDTLRLTWRLEGKGGAITLNIYNKTDQPLYITFSFGNNNAQEFAETSSFYIGQIRQTSSAPESFTLYRQQGDQFYITTSSNTR